MIITRSMTKGSPSLNGTSLRWSHHLFLSILGFIGVAGGAYITVQSVIALSAVFSIPEYLVSFFVVAFGTSLPEIVVDLTAVRKKQYGIAIGDAIGSSIIDAGFSIRNWNLVLSRQCDRVACTEDWFVCPNVFDSGCDSTYSTTESRQKVRLAFHRTLFTSVHRDIRPALNTT